MEFSLWENILLGIMIFGVLVWMTPNIGASLKLSKNAKKDWSGFLFPIAFVVMFVVFLISMV